MTSSVVDQELEVRARSVKVTDDSITVKLEDGRSVSVPTSWYPRLKHATAAERANYKILANGVWWPEVDADFSIRGILLGYRSGESAGSFKFWLDNYKRGQKVTLEDYSRHKRRPRSRKHSTTKH